MMRARPFAPVLIAILAATGPGASPVLARSFSWNDYARKPDAWYRSEEGLKVTANLLSQQSVHGSWPKNFDTAKEPYKGDRAKIQGTFDNGATFGELRFLAHAFKATGDAKVRDAFLKGLDLTLAAQYPN